MLLENKDLSIDARINKVNQLILEKGLRWEAGKSSISNLSPEEFKNISSGDIGSIENVLRNDNGEPQNVIYLPSTIPNWKDYMSEVELQEYNNCWAHAVTGVIEGLVNYYKESNTGIDLDEMFLTDSIDCACCGRNGGIPECGFRFIKDHKIRSEQNLNTGVNYDNGYFTISSYNVQSPTTSNSIKAALASSPVYASMYIYPDFQDYASGIYENTYGTCIGSHGVIIVGYNDSEGYWICKNSWGEDWGIDGYFYIAYGECGIDSRRCGSASVNSDSCLSKITPLLINDLTEAINYSFRKYEDAYFVSGSQTMSATPNSIITNSAFHIKSNATLNFNQYSILTSGGSIYISNGASLVPDIRLMNGTLIDGLYPNLVSAFDMGSTVEIHNDLTMSDNYTLPSGKTLKVLKNSDIKFPPGKYLNVNGTLNADGANFTSTSGTWGGIKFQSGSSGCLRNIEVSNALYGLYFNNASQDSANPAIRLGPSFIQNCSNYGIYIYNSSPRIDSCWVFDEPIYINNGHPHITQGYFDDWASYGQSVTLYSASPTFYKNEIISTQAQVTIMATNGSDPYFGKNPPGLNLLSADEYAEGVIWALSSSHPVLGDVMDDPPGWPPPPYYGTQNAIIGGLCASPAYADATSSIKAQYCWWGQTPPPDCYGNVNHLYHMTSAPPNVGSSFYKSVSTPLEINVFEDSSRVVANSMLTIAGEKTREGDYASARELLSEVITRYQASSYAHKALSLGVRLCIQHKEKDVIAFIDDLLNNVQDKTLKAAIKSRKISHLRHQQRINEAIAISEEMLKENADTEYELYALFDLFNYHHKDLNNNELADEYLSQLKDKYPDNNLTMIARSDVGEDISNIKLAKRVLPEEPLIEQETILPEAFALHHAYPNPFNPSTCIRVELPESGELVLDILDIRGRVVDRMLLNKPAGTHEIPYAPKQLSTGIYFIRARFKDQIQMRKIMYLK
ncbi:MAG: C1 family peptidase [Candidatus Marinimicrobia bacterium]|nr:C1 family peptidase [Candidatus Neomarinimicrobiota bacterium]